MARNDDALARDQRGCGFRAEDIYGSEFRGLIEVHHTRPLFMSGLQLASAVVARVPLTVMATQPQNLHT
jgi:hypothetical protein